LQVTSLSNAYALIVGIADYEHVDRLPSTVAKDAQAIYDVLVDPNHCAYPAANVKLLVDRQAVQGALQQALADLAVMCSPDSTLFVYFSGHGGRITAGPYSGEYFLPADVDSSSDDSLAQTALSGTAFTVALRCIPARKVVVVFDCCHASGLGQPKRPDVLSFKGGVPESYYDSLAVGRGRVILASSRSDEYSFVLPGAQNSLFTLHLLAGLRGSALGTGGLIRIFDLFHYLQPKVTADQPNQHPIFKAELEDNFPVALYRGGKSPDLTATLPPTDDFVYDAFVSYRQREPDKSWVRKTLVTTLELHKLRVCIDHRDFHLGGALVSEMERAVECSRYTLAVLSPQYLESDFAEFETVLAQHSGLEKGRRRLIAIMREECRPRLGMRAHLWLDMSDDNEFHANIARLVYELRQAPVS
jgi:hypothetical protein